MEDGLTTDPRDLTADDVRVCLDETARQPTQATRIPLPTAPGPPAAGDVEDERTGTANLVMLTAPLDGGRPVKVTDRRTRPDCAPVLRDRADTHFPDKTIILVMDTLNTHTLSTLDATVPPAAARRRAERFAIHHTPRHGAGLTRAEIAIPVLSRPCLDRRIPDRETLVREGAAWQARRNADRTPVNGRFRTEDARIKLKSLYPSLQ